MLEQKDLVAIANLLGKFELAIMNMMEQYDKMGIKRNEGIIEEIRKIK